MIIEVSLKENLKNKKIIKISENITNNELTKILSNKFNTKIISIGTVNGFEFDITKIIQTDNIIKLVCSQNLIEFNKLLELIQPNNEVFIKIYALNSYIPFEAISQLNELKNLNGIKYLIGMPDLHQGRFPIGSVVITDQECIYPELVGPDIGCGMSLIKTKIIITKYTSKQLEKIASQINIGNFIFDTSYTQQTHWDKFYSNNISIGNKINSHPVNSNWFSNYIKNMNISDTDTDINKIINFIEYLSNKYIGSMGTIGLGNHFVELLTLDKIKSLELVSKYSIDSNYYYILVHSGSRGLGEEILQMFQSNKINLCEYKILHDFAIDWAIHNRYAIATQFSYYVGTELEYLVDLTHNWVETKEIDNIKYSIHRKGAAPAYNLPIVIPGSRGTRTWFVEPNQNIQSIETGFSVSHGAGRKISRNKAQEGMKNKSIKDRNICCQGDSDISNIVICEDTNLFYEEAPFAYKDIQTVIDDLEHFKLATPICCFIPSITFKCKNKSN
jgi:release factor H-coupled RctB family protein